jgi:hypothetical protein
MLKRNVCDLDGLWLRCVVHDAGAVMGGPAGSMIGWPGTMDKWLSAHAQE